MSALTRSETRALEECESIIERGLATFVEVGQALLQIRDERLYKATHKTFEEYCRERWGWGRHYANRQIAAAEVAQNLVPMGTILENERQARALAPLSPEEQRRLTSSFNGKLPSAKVLAQMVREEAARQGITLREEPEEEPETEEQRRLAAEMEASGGRITLIWDFIRAIETLSEPRLPLEEVGAQIRWLDSAEKNWCERAPVALRNLKQLIEEMKP